MSIKHIGTKKAIKPVKYKMIVNSNVGWGELSYNLKTNNCNLPISTKHEDVEHLIDRSTIEVYSMNDTSVFIICELPFGHTIYEKYTFSDDCEFDINKGYEHCYNQLRSSLLDLESYAKLRSLYNYLE